MCELRAVKFFKYSPTPPLFFWVGEGGDDQKFPTFFFVAALIGFWERRKESRDTFYGDFGFLKFQSFFHLSCLL